MKEAQVTEQKNLDEVTLAFFRFISPEKHFFLLILITSYDAPVEQKLNQKLYLEWGRR